MSMDYWMFHPKTGKLISDERWAGMPFFYNCNLKYGKTCAIAWDNFLQEIKEWTCDKDSELWKSVHGNNIFEYNDNDIGTYYTREEIIQMQKTMTTNKTLLERLIDENDADGLIIHFCC